MAKETTETQSHREIPEGFKAVLMTCFYIEEVLCDSVSLWLNLL